MSMDGHDNKKSLVEFTLDETNPIDPVLSSTIEQSAIIPSNQFVSPLHEAMIFPSSNLEVVHQRPSSPVPSNPYSLEDNRFAFMPTPSLPSRSEGLPSSGQASLWATPFPMTTAIPFTIDASTNPTLPPYQHALPLNTTLAYPSLGYAPTFESLSMRSFSGYTAPVSDSSQRSIVPQNHTALSSFPMVQGGGFSSVNPYQQIPSPGNFHNVQDATVNLNQRNIENQFSETNWEAIQSYLTGVVRPGPDVPRIYRCNICQVEFPNAQAYGGHMSSHSKSNSKSREKPVVLAEAKRFKKTDEGQGSSQGKKIAPYYMVKEEEERTHANPSSVLGEEQQTENEKGNGEDALEGLSDRDE